VWLLLVAVRQGQGFADLVALDGRFTAGRRRGLLQAVRRDQRRVAVHDPRRDGSSLRCHNTVHQLLCVRCVRTVMQHQRCIAEKRKLVAFNSSDMSAA